MPTTSPSPSRTPSRTPSQSPTASPTPSQSQSPTTPPSQFTANDFYNDELKRLNAKQQNANSILNSQERLAALNDSYRKRYAKYVQILMVLVLAYGVYLAMILAQKMFPAIPQIAVDGVIILLIFLVSIYLFSASWELYTRSVLNYDELEISAYDASGVDVSRLAEEGQIFNSPGSGGSKCIGEACCEDPTKYDSTTNKCKDSFTTLEYTKLDSAYTNVSFNSELLKRSPSANQVNPLQDMSSLVYSKF
jgi:hypothetical protein